MAGFKFLVIAALIFLSGQCATSNSNLHIPQTKQESQLSVDYRKLIIGTWEGESPQNNNSKAPFKMYVTFNESNMIVDESPSGGGKSTIPYKFKDDRVIEQTHYEDNLVIEKISDNQIRFRPESNELREAISMIFVCAFRRK